LGWTKSATVDSLTRTAVHRLEGAFTVRRQEERCQVRHNAVIFTNILTNIFQRRDVAGHGSAGSVSGLAGSSTPPAETLPATSLRRKEPARAGSLHKLRTESYY
jgi:hypothetical protein